MGNVTVHFIEQGSDQWLKLREKLYTGADSYKLLEHNTKSKIIDGVRVGYGVNMGSSFKGTFYTKRGHILEDQAIALYNRLHGCTVPRPGFITNDRFPHCGYSPDAYPDDLNIEVKAFQKGRHLALWNEAIDIKILSQIYFGLVISEKKEAILIPFNPLFARKEIEVDGRIVTNPDYQPRKAYKEIPIKLTYSIRKNFENKLREAFV